jgi:hypothetical protein
MQVCDRWVLHCAWHARLHAPGTNNVEARERRLEPTKAIGAAQGPWEPNNQGFWEPNKAFLLRDVNLRHFCSFWTKFWITHWEPKIFVSLRWEPKPHFIGAWHALVRACKCIKSVTSFPLGG